MAFTVPPPWQSRSLLCAQEFSGKISEQFTLGDTCEFLLSGLCSDMRAVSSADLLGTLEKCTFRTLNPDC